MFEASHLQYNTVSGYIQIVADGRYSPAFWAHPQLGGPFPGVVLLHDSRGLTASVRNYARRLAEHGFYVVVPDLIGEHASETDRRRGAWRSVSAAIAALKSHHHCSGKLGLLGWQSGGVLALHVAGTRDDLQAVVTIDGLPGPGAEDELPMDDLTAIPGAVLAVFARPSSAGWHEKLDVLVAALGRLRGHWSILRYADSPVGFYDDTSAEFDAELAFDVWQHILRFLNECLEAHRPPERDAFDTDGVY